MKACKKLLSLLLVAVLLVSAIPFQAKAAKPSLPGNTEITVKVTINFGKYGGPENESVKLDSKTVTAAQLVKEFDPAYEEYFTITKVTANGTEVSKTNAFNVSNGMSIVIDLEDIPEDNNGDGYFGDNTYPNGPTTEAPTTEAPTTEAPTTEAPTTEAPTTEAPVETYSMTLYIYDKNDSLVETKKADVPKTTVTDWIDDFKGSIADILDEFDSAYTASQVKSGFANTNQVVMMLNVAGNAGGNNNGGNDDGNNGGNNGSTKYTITTSTGASYKAVYGKLYKDFLGTPAKPGYKFICWDSEAHGRVTSETYVTGNDHVTAIWEAVDYTMTFVVSRDGEEMIVAGKRFNMGDTISADDLAWGKSACAEYVPEGYKIIGWKVNGEVIKAGDTYKWQGDVRAIAILAGYDGSPVIPTRGKVYLEVYVNGKTAPNEIDKRIEVPEKYYSDGVLTRQEVLDLLTEKGLLGTGKRYAAKSGYTLAYDGLFTEAKWYDYCHDKETKGAASINIVYNSVADKYISLMIRNVKVSTADTTNPKTGDYILPVSMTIMVMSAVAAAAVYVTSKKRSV